MKNKSQELEYVPLPENDSYFYNHDLGLSAGLVVMGFELASLDRSNPKKVKFIFQGKNGISEVVKNYWDSTLPVDAQTYFNAVRRLKNQIYSQPE
jgi:hypothetical protein